MSWMVVGDLRWYGSGKPVFFRVQWLILVSGRFVSYRTLGLLWNSCVRAVLDREFENWWNVLLFLMMERPN